MMNYTFARIIEQITENNMQIPMSSFILIKKRNSPLKIWVCAWGSVCSSILTDINWSKIGRNGSIITKGT